jgi:DNA-binding LacI/PurR family transcriptional regulator
MPSLRRATIIDVAKAAGVAVGTVSRVFNNHVDVNGDIREKVVKAARDLGYSRLRQRKRTRDQSDTTRHENIAVICFGMEDTLVQLPVISTALQGIEHSLSKQGRSLMLANIPKGDRVPPFLTEQHVEGLILKGPNQGELPSRTQNELLNHIYRLPHVWMMGRLPGAEGDHCNFDTDSAGRIAADHLLKKGHTHVAFMNPKPGQNQFERLKVGFRIAAERNGQKLTLLEVELPEKLTWPLPAITLPAKVSALTDQWLALPENQRPTAIFVPSDRTAVQLYEVLERRRMRVGRDVSVISCNNEKSLLMSLNPGLTTIDVHAETIGSRAVDQLMWRIQHPDEPHSIQLLVEPSLAERASVAQR